MLRRRGRQQTIWSNGQLVCSRPKANDELTLGSAAAAFDPSLLRDAIDQLAASIGHSVPGHHDNAARHPGLEDQQQLFRTGPDVRLVAHRCERCASSMIYEAAGRGPVALCPACSLREMTTVTTSAELVVGLIHQELTKHLKDSRQYLPRGAADSIDTGLRRLRALGDQLGEYGPTHGNSGRAEG